MGAALASLQWRYVHDSPLLIYAALLIDRGAVPYRDFFDMNMPETYFVLWTMGRLFGWTDLASRFFDLSLLALLSFATWTWMRPMGRLSAAYAAVSFPLYYLAGGAGMSLQRELIALVPLSLALSLSCRGATSLRPALRGFLVGALTASALLIKPQFLLLCLPAIAFLVRNTRTEIRLHRMALAWLAGLSLPFGATLLYLAATGGLAPFLDMARNYWPLYAHMTRDHRTIQGVSRTIYIARSSLIGLGTPFLPVACLGLLVRRRAEPGDRRTVWWIGALLAAATLYSAVSGQFWDYHWLPFHYFALCATALAVWPPAFERSGVTRFLAFTLPVLLLLSFSAPLAVDLYWEARMPGEEVPLKDGVPDEVHGFLCSHLRPGDTVQPLDWTGGAVHGMLLARAPLATRFLYDFHFYHHVSSPYIQKLRRQFMEELTQAKPRFVIQVLGEKKPWPVGTDTTRSFPRLQAYLKQRYRVAKEGATYRILERVHEGSPVPVSTMKSGPRSRGLEGISRPEGRKLT